MDFPKKAVTVDWGWRSRREKLYGKRYETPFYWISLILFFYIFDWFAKDNNTGLVTQITDAFRRFSILKLEKTYVALRIGEVAERTSPDSKNFAETANYVKSLIFSHQLNAHLIESSEDPRNWILQFAQTSMSGPQAKTEQQQYTDLVQQKNRIIKLTTHVKDVDRRLGLSKEYIGWTKKMAKSKDPSNDLNPLMFPNDDYVGDEDVMADL